MTPEITPPIFVFNSNLLGLHTHCSAAFAQKNFGAITGRGQGLSGQSYALPTRVAPWRRLPFCEVARHSRTFLAFAAEHPQQIFHLTRVGCGHHGFPERKMAELFAKAPANVLLIDDQARHLGPAALWLSLLEKHGSLPIPPVQPETTAA